MTISDPPPTSFMFKPTDGNEDIKSVDWLTVCLFCREPVELSAVSLDGQDPGWWAHSSDMTPICEVTR
jgi:hypothetical protein